MRNAESSYTVDETDIDFARLTYAVLYNMSRPCIVIIFTCSELEKFCRRQSLITSPLLSKT
jgi:hypothetical protein